MVEGEVGNFDITRMNELDMCRLVNKGNKVNQNSAVGNPDKHSRHSGRDGNTHSLTLRKK